MKMFKMLSVVFAMLFVMSGSVVMAGGWTKNVEVHESDSSFAPTLNDYSAIGSYNHVDGGVIGFGVKAYGGTSTEGKALASGYMEAEGFAYSGGISGVHSNSWFLGKGFGIGAYELGVSGFAGAGSEALAYKGNGPKATWASGGSYGEGSYDAGTVGLVLFYGKGELNGYAGAASGTIAFADRGRNNTTAYSVAGALTASVGGAYTDAPKCFGWSNTNALGSGNVSHQTYAETVGGAWAGTNGSASFAYNNNGGNSVIGGGIAGTGGISVVSQTPNSASVHSQSFGFAASSGGFVRQQQ